jgi:hypothetical protein
VSNPNLQAVNVGSLGLDTSHGTGGFTVDGAHTGCLVSSLSLARQDNDGAGWSVPARTGGVDGTLSVTLPDALVMAANAASACQGAHFTVYLVAGP